MSTDNFGSKVGDQKSPRKYPFRGCLGGQMGTFRPSFDPPTETLATPKAFPLKIPYRATCRDPIFHIFPYVTKNIGRDTDCLHVMSQMMV